MVLQITDSQLFIAYADLNSGKIWLKSLSVQEKCVPLQPGKSYTASSLSTPPGLDRSKGSRL